MLGAQGELDVFAFLAGGVVFLLGLGTAIGAADHQEDSRKRHDA
jgi:hypothetical protein